MNFDRNKSLQELENSDWGDPDNEGSSLVNDCLSLRRIPLKDFDGPKLVEMISQDIGIDYLIPMALELLRADPLADRQFYPGCLLSTLLQASSRYWDKHSDLRDEIERIYQGVLANKARDEDLRDGIVSELNRSYLIFTEFGSYESLLWDNAYVKLSCNCTAVRVLSIIASRQPITWIELENLLGFKVYDPLVQSLIDNQFIAYDDEGPHTAERFFKLKPSFLKRIIGEK